MSCGGNDGRPNCTSTIWTGASGERVDRAAAAIDPRFEDAVHAVEDAYGEAIVRRIWSVPDLALSPERKRAALDVTVRR